MKLSNTSWSISFRLIHNSSSSSSAALIANVPSTVLSNIVSPRCYCDKVAEEGKKGFSKINVAPVFVLPDQDKHLVPLLPKCTISKLDNQENVNTNTNSSLFWPKASKDILCTELMNSGFISDVIKNVDEE